MLNASVIIIMSNTVVNNTLSTGLFCIMSIFVIYVRYYLLGTFTEVKFRWKDFSALWYCSIVATTLI